MPTTRPNAQTVADVEKCVRFLKDLELRWSGARRSMAIIEQLLADHSRKSAAGGDEGGLGEYRGMGEAPSGKRTFDEFEAVAEEPFWQQIPGSELFGFDGLEAGLFTWSGGGF